MPANPPDDMPRITAYLLYEDLEHAIDWLVETFGMAERSRMSGPDGKAAHAEMSLGEGVVMMGHPGPDYQNPKRHGHVCQLVHVYVDDVDEHCDSARAAGATILSEPEEKPYGDRVYSAEDIEGHHWFFAQHVRDDSI
jgi:uncharacterized glyoxalase superfamily protein PhnB